MRFDNITQVENPITKITRHFPREDGSEVRIVATLMFGAGLHPSADLYAHRRTSPDTPWQLLSSEPHPDARSMSIEEYNARGRSPLLTHTTFAERVKTSGWLGLPQATFDNNPDANPYDLH